MKDALTDSYGRAIRDLRVSLTDRCNFRCFYCLPHGEPPMSPKSQTLSYEEIERACEIFVSLGVEKIRLTGGEPMLRRDLDVLVGKLAPLKAQGLRDLALTTNGYFLPDQAQTLKDAGLDRVTVSLDSLRRETFDRMTGVDALDKVLKGIAAAKLAGLTPIKINAVVVRGYNEGEVADFAAFAREHGVMMRFIEFMPLDSGHDWSRDAVVSGREIRERIEERFALVPARVRRGAETSSRWLFADGAPGEIGIIAPVTEAFCGACSRIRLTADGQIRTCLFSTVEHSLRDVLRGNSSRAEVIEYIEGVVLKKEPRHFIDDPGFRQPARTMSFIGG
ncbi:MAG: GTP 3',8-cyclase MoaA [Acidobacteria bacterium]|nr:GTP 3',8-cyclase MoaA [Acidobacteriota bacterium]MCA1642238.1 GTP 3',8-cyclase MoaA [Acidobacteriota bacterium]